MKTCSRCKEEKGLDAFYKRKDGYYNQPCRVCKSAYNLARYHNDADYRDKQHKRSKKQKDQQLQRVWDYLLQHPCVDCGETDPIVLEFDHREQSNKHKEVGELYGCTWSRIEKEIAKCDVRCANCHRRRTANQLGWYKGIK